ncbi:hypothetical protein [Amphritea pacifica]|uniref:hypothetical protein n=1 Tax=Amphritea pacifica TaxID=2811233 RepID=UPI001962FAB8|nr:hypothetical protein [Amphritea pacifica]MBN1006546.1 hypothetical protein [Amphritea pacifica]
MLLEKFNDYPKLINVGDELESSKYTYVDEVGGEVVTGVGDILEGELIYFYSSNGKLLLRYRNIETDLTEPDISLSFNQPEDGVSEFKVSNRKGIIFSLKYDAWWKSKPAGSPAGFGSSGDEDEDLLAYLTLMSQSENRLQHLIQKYS